MNPPNDNNSTVVQKPLMDVTEKDAYKEKLIAFVNPKSYEKIEMFSAEICGLIII